MITVLIGCGLRRAPRDLRRRARLCHQAGGNWSRFNSFLVMFRSKRPNIIWFASSASAMP